MRIQEQCARVAIEDCLRLLEQGPPSLEACQRACDVLRAALLVLDTDVG